MISPAGEREPHQRTPGPAGSHDPVGHHAPSGVRSPSRPSGRKTRIGIRIPNTIERVQSLPGECQLEPSLNGLDEADQQRAEHGAGEVPDAAEDGGGEGDQARA